MAGDVRIGRRVPYVTASFRTLPLASLLLAMTVVQKSIATLFLLLEFAILSENPSGLFQVMFEVFVAGAILVMFAPQMMEIATASSQE